MISGNINVQPVSYIEEKIEGIITNNNFQYTHSFDISQNLRESFIVQNYSKTYSVIVQLLDSPGDIQYQIDLPEVEVKADSFKILTPTRFVRYKKIAYRSKEFNKSCKIDIYYQAQGNKI